MSRLGRGVARMVGIVVLSMPVTFLATFALMPLWSAIERRWGIESVGHSGPAEWCYWVVFAMSIIILSMIDRRLRAPRGEGAAAPPAR